MIPIGVYVQLNDAMIAEADARTAAIMAFHTKRGTPNPYLFAGWDQTGQHLLGCRCERAAAPMLEPLKKTPVNIEDWHNTPDFGDFVDVKGVRLDRHSLMCPVHRLRKEFAYLLVSAEQHPIYWLAGWAWGSDFVGKTNHGGEAWTIRIDDPLLRPIETLCQEIERRTARPHLTVVRTDSHRCAQCLGTPDGTEREFFEVWLHPECRRFYRR
jgi:hypothetical protein